MKPIFLILITLLFSLVTPKSYGQRNEYPIFQNILLSTEASVATCFLQDTQGLMWIGTNKGLFSYDGYTTQAHFKLDEATNSWIYSGVVIKERYLYLGTDNGILIYDTYSDTYLDSSLTFPTDIRSLALQGYLLWIGTLHGLYAYDIQSQRIDKWEATRENNLPHSTIYSLLPTKEGALYIGTYNGLCVYDSTKQSFSSIPLSKEAHLTNLFVNSLVEDVERGCIWIGTEGSLLRYTLQNKKVEQIEAVQANSIKSLALDGNGTLLIGTDNGLYTYHEDKAVTHILHDSRNHRSLANNTIWSIFQDQHKNSWLGTNYGISLANAHTIFHYTPLFQLTGSGEGNQFLSLYKDSKDNYWFGGSNGVLRFRKEASSDQVHWYKMDSPTHPLSHNRIRHIYEDKEGELWIATDGSISRYDYQKEQFVNYQITDSTLTHNSNWAYNILEDNRGKLWIASCLGGIFIVDKQSLKEKKKSPIIAQKNLHTEDGLSSSFINQLVSDKQGNVWALLYQNGINQINSETYEVTVIDTDSYTEGRKLNFLLADKEGTLWAGFRGGFLKIEPETRNIECSWFDRFSHDEIFYMEEVENEIWISTSNECWAVEKESLAMYRWGTTKKSFNSIYYDTEEQLVFLGENDGFSTTTPHLLKTAHLQHNLVATRFYVNGEPYSLDGTIRYERKIKLTHQQNNVTIELSDFPYSLHEKSQFAYRIKENSAHWSLLPSQSNQILYNNLQPGSYTLEVSRLDSNGELDPNYYTLSLTISPPWYYTFWAKLIYLLGICGVILWIINFFRIKARLQIERLEKEKIKEQARQKIELFTHLSHDFKTPLSLIIAPLSKRMGETVHAQEYKFLEGVWQNAMKLNALIHQTLDFNRIENNNQALLILSQTEIISFAHSVFTGYLEAAQEKGIHAHFTSNIEKLEVEIDRIKWQSIFDNLLSNALKYTPSGKAFTLAIEYDREKSQLYIRLADQGIGISSEELPYIFQRFFQASHTREKQEGTGIGLYLVKTYAELHQAKIEVDSTLNSGTTFTVTLPIPMVEALNKEQASVIHNPVDNLDWKPKEQKSQKKIKNQNLPVILVVEDNPEVIEFIEEVITPSYRCVKAYNGKEGLNLSKELLPDLIVTDLLMPEMDGMELCRELKKCIPTSNIPLIMLTAQNDSTTELESIQLQIDAFISKPFDPNILVSRMEQLLQRKQRQETQLRIETISTPKEIEVISHDEKFLKEVTQLIEDRIDDAELNVTALCEMVQVSNKQLYRKVKQLTGQTPVDYIRSIRLKKAGMLLRQNKFSISEVMYMVGFSSSSYFSKCFQSAFGMTPKQYMDSHNREA
ncbi:MAG: hybrid sensor histidine kinase/response regulator transcription factor [Phocaeicola sp.]